MSKPVIRFPRSSADISIREFESWLDQFTPSQIVGRGGDARACPVACFLAIQGYDHPFVDQQESRFGDASILWPRRPSLTNPEWVRRFIEKIDDHANVEGQEIQARTARHILTEVIEEVGDDAA